MFVAQGLGFSDKCCHCNPSCLSWTGPKMEEEEENRAAEGPDLEKIKRQLAPPAGSVAMQGYLLKRSETLRRWNQRWFTLDPTIGKMEYRAQRGDPYPRGLIVFEADSTITVSPINFHGARQYEGCCFYIGVSRKKEYFLCAETPGAARAWVATLRAAALVLKAHREAVDSLAIPGGGRPRSGAVAAAAAVASATARESAKEVERANQKAVLAPMGDAQMAAGGAADEDNLPRDNLSIMRETLRVKDEELHQMAADIRARDATIADLAARLTETAEAAESAAAAAHSLDKERALHRSEAERMKEEVERVVTRAAAHMKEADEREKAAVSGRNAAVNEFLRTRKETDAEMERRERQVAERDEQVAQLAAELERVRAEVARKADRVAELEGLLSQQVQEVSRRDEVAEQARQEALREADTWRAEAVRVMRLAAGSAGLHAPSRASAHEPPGGATAGQAAVATPAEETPPGHADDSKGEGSVATPSAPAGSGTEPGEYSTHHSLPHGEATARAPDAFAAGSDARPGSQQQAGPLHPNSEPGLSGGPTKAPGVPLHTPDSNQVMTSEVAPPESAPPPGDGSALGTGGDPSALLPLGVQSGGKAGSQEADTAGSRADDPAMLGAASETRSAVLQPPDSTVGAPDQPSKESPGAKFEPAAQEGTSAEGKAPLPDPEAATELFEGLATHGSTGNSLSGA